MASAPGSKAQSDVREESTPQPITITDYDDAMAKRVLRKIDWRLLPLMFITYNFNFMDKTILSSASVFGLREDTVSIVNPRS
jgi:hypothetical protein